MRISSQLHLLLLGLLSLGVLAAVLFSFTSYEWSGWIPATCMPNRCFCEQLRPGVIRQPMNTWSNLAFVVVGAVVLWRVRTPLSETDAGANPMTTDTLYPLVYGTMAGVLGLGSLFYHASLSFVGQWMDVMGMYLVASFLILYNLATLRGWGDRLFTLSFVALNGALGVLQYALPGARRWMFAGLVLGAIVAEIWGLRARATSLTRGFLWAAMGCLALAFGLWWLDLKKIVCTPDSWFQLHSLWHLLCACTTGFVYLYYCSERRPQEDAS